MRQINREIVSAVITSSDGKLLFGRKDPNRGGVYPGCWHIPGGGINEGEERLAALIRELKEEVGIVVAPSVVQLIDDKGIGTAQKTLGDGEVICCNMRFFVYHVQIAQVAQSIPVIAGDDLVEICWFERSELGKLPLTPPSRELFIRLGWIAK